MKKTHWLAVCFFATILGSAAAHGACGVEVEDAWARATVKGISAGGVFLDIENEGENDITLKSASSPVAQEVQIHNHVDDNGVMRMREVEGGVVVPAGGEVEFRPGGYHLMLIGLKKTLKEGARFPLTLKFDGMHEQTVQVEVRKAGASAPQHHHDHEHDHSHKHTH